MPNSVQPLDTLQVNSVSETSSIRAAAKQSQHKLAQDDPTKAIPKDTVKISAQSQIIALKQRGASPTEIAAKLGLSVTDVNAALSPSSSNYESGSSVLAALSGKRAAAQASLAQPQS